MCRNIGAAAAPPDAPDLRTAPIECECTHPAGTRTLSSHTHTNGRRCVLRRRTLPTARPRAAPAHTHTHTRPAPAPRCNSRRRRTDAAQRTGCADGAPAGETTGSRRATRPRAHSVTRSGRGRATSERARARASSLMGADLCLGARAHPSLNGWCEMSDCHKPAVEHDNPIVHAIRFTTLRLARTKTSK